MAKAVVQNWVTSALGVAVIFMQMYATARHGVPLDPAALACGAGLLAAKDGG